MAPPLRAFVAVSLTLLTASPAQTPDRPVLEAPVVVLSSNSSVAIELIDTTGNGDWRGISARVQISPTSTFVAIGQHYYGAPLSAQNSPLVSGNIPTLGPMIPRSDAGPIGAPDPEGEAVVAVGAEVFVVDGLAIAQTWTGSNLIWDVAVGDFDGDGNGDVAMLSSHPSGGLQLELHLWNGAALAPAATHPLPATAGLQLLRAELDGDLSDDLVVVGQQVQGFRYAAGGGGFTQLFDEHVGTATPMPVAGDIDGDGDEDLVVFDATQYTVLRRTGPATFVEEAPVVGGPATHLYDVDGDGDLDGACCSSGGSYPDAMYTDTTFHIAINEGGVFLPAYTMKGVGGYHLAGVADIDGNGLQDLVAGRVVYFAQRSLGEPRQQAGPGHDLRAQVLFDADADGDHDVVTQVAAQLHNAGDGSFAQVPASLPPPPAGAQFAPPVLPGDFDGDGDTDLIVEVRQNGTPVGTRLLLQRGASYADGGQPFPPDVALSPWIGQDSRAAVAADLDGDGDVDLAINSTGQVMYSMLWHNDGAGEFEATPLLGFLVKACADFTTDGLPDLLVSDGRLMLMRGQAGGGFQAAEFVVPIGQSSTSFHLTSALDVWNDQVAVGDFDHDGVPDVAVGMRDPSGCCNSLKVLWNHGFAGQVFAVTPGVAFPYLNAASPTRLAVGDFDGDGVDDLAVGNPIDAHAGGTGVLFGIGNGQTVYEPFRQYDEQLFTTPIGELADLDGDGDVDLVGERVVFNPLLQAPDAGIRRQWGTGTPGAGGVVPCLGARGVVAVNRPLDVVCSGAQGQTCGLLALGTTTWNVALFGGTSYVLPDATATWCSDGVPGTPGDGRLQLPLGPLDSSLAGAEVHLQAALIDSAVGITLTNALTLRIGQ